MLNKNPGFFELSFSLWKEEKIYVQIGQYNSVCIFINTSSLFIEIELKF